MAEVATYPNVASRTLAGYPVSSTFNTLPSSSIMTAHYGETAARYFHLPEARVLRTSSLQMADVTVTRLTAPERTVNLTDPIPAANSLVLCLQLQPLTKHELWLDGSVERVRPYDRGAISVVDLATRPVAYLPTAFDCIQFVLPHTTLEQFAAAEGRAGVRELAIGHGTRDPFVESIGALLLPALNGVNVSRLFVDGLMVALHHHLTARYGGVLARDGAGPGPLARWQLERATALIDANLDDGISLLQLAAACELSPSYFSRAFRKTTGWSPSQWLTQRRVEKAQGLLEGTGLPLSEIAFLCGFADQSHFTRVFSKMKGVAPAKWRRLRR